MPLQGTVFQDASTGRWVAEVSAGHDETGKRKRIRRKARTKTEALHKLKDMQRQVDDGVPTGRAAMTISELLDFFLDTVVMSRDPSVNTVDNYKWTCSHLKPELGRKKLNHQAREQPAAPWRTKDSQVDTLARDSPKWLWWHCVPIAGFRMRNVLATATSGTNSTLSFAPRSEP